MQKPVRVIVYIDGFNLYFGLKARGWTRFLWLNLQKMAQRLLKPYQMLTETKYFTARVKLPRDKQARQNRFIEALETLPEFGIFYGRYQINRRTCPKCRHVDHVANEKMTDVNIAAEMLADAFTDRFDTAILLSADADLSLAVQKITGMAGKRVVCVFPSRATFFRTDACCFSEFYPWQKTPRAQFVSCRSQKEKRFCSKMPCFLGEIAK